MTHIHDIHTIRWIDTCKDTVTNEQAHGQVVTERRWTDGQTDRKRKTGEQTLKRTDKHTETLNMDTYKEDRRTDGRICKHTFH